MIFFQCRDVEKMKKWYGKNLGLVTSKKVPATFLSIAGDPDKGCRVGFYL